MKSIQNLDQYKVKNLDSFAKVSIIIAVKDGEREIEATVQRLLKCDYPDFEIIIVNDRSSDRTEEILQKIKATNSKLINVQVKELPQGWLGKVHALHQGVKHATGEFILFMDADVSVGEEALKASVNASQIHKLDHLAVLPEFLPGEYFLNVMTTTSVFLFVLSSKPWLDIEKRPVEATKGVGAYNFVRRLAFEKTEGFDWLKMDVADDVALAQLLAKNGGRSLLMRSGTSQLELSWYESFKKLVLGLEKNIVGGFTNYRLELIFIITLISLLVSIVPLIALLFVNVPIIFYSGIFFFLTTLFFAFFVKKLMKQSFATILAFPLGISLLGLILLRASFICFRNGGIRWSGTLYPLKQLKKGTRVKLGL
ncbi:MAG: glycosyltransferase [Bdellovibrionales bacterium]|nr:glycosyltransferase [Bdellovibrionales bacterium]